MLVVMEMNPLPEEEVTVSTTHTLPASLTSRQLEDLADAVMSRGVVFADEVIFDDDGFVGDFLHYADPARAMLGHVIGSAMEDCDYNLSHNAGDREATNLLRRLRTIQKQLGLTDEEIE